MDHVLPDAGGWPTQFPDLNSSLGELTGRAQSILGDNFVGAYPQGTTGGGRSPAIRSHNEGSVASQLSCAGAPADGLRSCLACLQDTRAAPIRTLRALVPGARGTHTSGMRFARAAGCSRGGPW